MITRKGVKSATTPVEIFYTTKNVYVRSNIEKVNHIDPVFNNATVLYKYDEDEYTVEEWNSLNIKKLEDKIEVLEKTVNELHGLILSIYK